MIEPIWKQKRPTASEIKQMWREMQVVFEPMEHPAIEELLHHLRVTHVNGGAEFACFKLSENPTLHWFGSRNRLEEINFFDRFLSLPVIAEALPVLKLKESKIADTNFDWSETLTFDGELALKLVRGGAYHEFDGSPRAAKEIGVRSCDALFGDRFMEVQMYKTNMPFTEWFYNAYWNATWLGFDKREIKVWLLCVTDTD